MKKQIILFIILSTLLSIASFVGCGGGGNTVAPVQVVVTNTPVIEPTATPVAIKYGSISGQVLTSTGTGYTNAFVVFQSLVVNEKIESSGLLTQTTTAGIGGYYAFNNVPQGACSIFFWASQSDYQSNPNNPLGSVLNSVTDNTTGVSIQQGQIAPTPTSTPVVTNTSSPGITPTPTPTQPDISGQFNIVADYYIAPDPNTGVNSGNLIVQLYQKTTSTLSVKGFKILATDNLDFPFSGAIPYKGTYNRPPEDWTEQADLTKIQWKGYTALSKSNIYSFNIKYSNIPTMPKILKVTLTGAETSILGTLTVDITQRVLASTPTPGTFSVTSSTTSGHTHNITVLLSDLNNPPSSGKTYTSSTTNGHSHALTLTQAQLIDINNGNTVTVISSNNNGHTHTWTIMKNFSVTSGVTSSHTHSLTMSMADIGNPPVSGVTYTSSTTNGHTHNVYLTQSQLNSINTGNAVTVTSSIAEGHTHSFSIVSPNPAPTPTPPINVTVQ